MPKPTPFNIYSSTMLIIDKNGQEREVTTRGMNPRSNRVSEALDYLEAGKDIPQKDFSFSQITIEILHNKLQGTYVQSDWKPFDDPSNLGVTDLSSFAE